MEPEGGCWGTRGSFKEGARGAVREGRAPWQCKHGGLPRGEKTGGVAGSQSPHPSPSSMLLSPELPDAHQRLPLSSPQDTPPEAGSQCNVCTPFALNRKACSSQNEQRHVTPCAFPQTDRSAGMPAAHAPGLSASVPPPRAPGCPQQPCGANPTAVPPSTLNLLGLEQGLICSASLPWNTAGTHQVPGNK